MMSNIIISARYVTADGTGSLTKPAVYDALRAVIVKRPELGAVGVIGPSKKKGRHRLNRVLLHHINLDSCVEFIDAQGAAADAEFLERCHNDEWGWTDVGPGRPWWKVFILNGRDLVFVAHHSVCDGGFGLIFHRDVLDALNSSSTSKAREVQTSPHVAIDPATASIAPDINELTDTKMDILKTILVFIFYSSVRLLFGNRRLFFSDAPAPRPTTLSVTAIAQPSQRTVSRLVTFRIPATKMAAILRACRSHETTFTPFLVVLITTALATDAYPDATLGFSRWAVDMRPLLRAPPAGATVMDAAGGLDAAQWLGAFRRAAGHTTPRRAVNAAALWGSVRTYGARIRATMAGPAPRAISAARSCDLLGSDLEDVLEQAFPSMGLHLRNSFSVSNLGAFSGQAGEGDVNGPWRIEDVQFSAGATDGTYSHNGIVFNVAGVKGGETVINAVWEDGALKKEMVEGVMKSVAEMMDALAPL